MTPASGAAPAEESPFAVAVQHPTTMRDASKEQVRCIPSA
jgi:hypothetical protein